MAVGQRRQRFQLDGLTLKATDSRPLYRQLEQYLRRAIREGKLPAGERLPSTRDLAAQLGIARNTTLKAYEQLLMEGYLESRRGSGTCVAQQLPEDLLHAPRRHSGPSTAGAGSPGLGPATLRFRRVQPWMREEIDHPSRPFRAHTPASDAFPRAAWAQLTNRLIRTMPRAFMEQANSRGYGPLREAIAGYLGMARDLTCTADNVMITGGVQQGVELLARLLIEPGDLVVMENPGYAPAAMSFELAGARVRGVPVDGEGLVVAALQRLRRPPKLVYITPGSQFPTGVMLSLPRRLALLEWAERHDVMLVEDDYNGEYRYAGRPLDTLHALAPPGRVIYAGSFSKLLFPTLRLGYLVAPVELVDYLAAARWMIDRHSPPLEQAVLADFINRGHFARHVRRMRVLYAERQRYLVAAARRHLDGILAVAPLNAGLHLVGYIQPPHTEASVMAAAAVAGVELMPVSWCNIAPVEQPAAVLLGYAPFTEREMERAARALRQACEAGLS